MKKMKGFTLVELMMTVMVSCLFVVMIANITSSDNRPTPKYIEGDTVQFVGLGGRAIVHSVPNFCGNTCLYDVRVYPDMNVVENIKEFEIEPLNKTVSIIGDDNEHY